MLLVGTHLDERILYILSCLVGELRQEDVGHTVVEPAIIGYCVKQDLAAMYLEVDWLIDVWALHSKVERRSSLSAQFLAHFGGALLDHALSIDAEDGITHTYTGFHGRPSFVRIGDDYSVATLLDEGADATIFAGGHSLEV